MAAQKSFFKKIDFSFSINLQEKAFLSVKKGQSVSQDQVIATVEKVIEEDLNLAKSLGIKPKKAVQFLIKGLGQKVKKNQLIAQKKGLFSLKKIYSPLDGQLDSVNEDGVLKICSSSKKEIKTEFAGKISSFSGKKLILKFAALAVTGSWGTGPKTTGFLKMISGGSKKKDIFKIKDDISGKILIVRGKISRAFWFKALSLGVAGIACGCFEKTGLRKLIIEQQSIIKKQVKKNYFAPLIVIEDQPINPSSWQELKKHQDKKVLIDGEKALLVIPL